MSFLELNLIVFHLISLKRSPSLGNLTECAAERLKSKTATVLGKILKSGNYFAVRFGKRNRSSFVYFFYKKKIDVIIRVFFK